MTKEKNRSYTAEFKEEAVRLALRSPSISDVADNLGIPKATLHTWVKADPSQKDSSKEELLALSTEFKALKKELNQVKEEREILKKAAVYFARESK